MVDINEVWSQEMLRERVSSTMDRIVEEGFGVSMRRGSLPEVASDLMRASAAIKEAAGGSSERVVAAVKDWRQLQCAGFLHKAAASLSANERQQLVELLVGVGCPDIGPGE